MTQTPEPLASRGEEFRTDERQVKVRRLPPEILRELTTLDDLRSTGALLQTLALIITLIVLAVGSQQGPTIGSSAPSVRKFTVAYLTQNPVSRWLPQ
jgi:hypothetical protein